MIRFCDKEVYIAQFSEIDRHQILDVFLGGGNISSGKQSCMPIIACYDELGSYKGIITYERFLTNGINECVNQEVIKITDCFWEEARSYFEQNPKELLPILGADENLIGFCYNDRNDYIWEESIVSFLEKQQDPLFFISEMYPQIQQVCITDLNEISWRFYQLLKKNNYPVCVVGEKWEWFGIKSFEGYIQYPDYAKLFIYAEGTDNVREERIHEPSLFPPVYDNFEFLTQWAGEKLKDLFRIQIKKFKDIGVPVCACRMPETTDVEYLTDLEEKSIALCADKNRLTAINKKRYGEPTREMLKCLQEIVGVEAFNTIKDVCTGVLTGDEGRKNIPAGELVGVAMESNCFEKRIYIIGACIVWGKFDPQEETLINNLQKMTTKDGYMAVGIFVPVDVFENKYDLFKKLEKLPVRSGDIIIFIDTNGKKGYLSEKMECQPLDLKPVYDEKNRRDYFTVTPYHTNAAGNNAIAHYIYENYLKNEIIQQSKVTHNGWLQYGELLNTETINTILKYTSSIKEWDGYGDECIGAIVMNCNPFTYGHKYLIDYALTKVDKLYIFVVEEDRSFFTFKDRFEMVQQGTREYSNVKVVPSGEWVLSWKTLPLYFLKEECKTETADARTDLEIFARYIAPTLGITCRFIGEEPLDPITRQYNLQMHKILEEFGIEVNEIMRKGYQGNPISASYVRKCMEEERWKELKNYLPESSYKFCLSYKNNRSKYEGLYV